MLTDGHVERGDVKALVIAISLVKGERCEILSMVKSSN